jgi:AcrR family transcriptional regulator
VPAVAKTTDDEIAAAARRLLESGRGDFSMAAVAEATGVRAPSLYKRYADRQALLARVRRDAYVELGLALARSAKGPNDRERLRAMAGAYRKFARKNPRFYGLLFSRDEDSDTTTSEARVASVASALEILRRVVGPDRALDAARTLTAFLHGHITMAQAGAFHLGGDVDGAFTYGVERVLDGIFLHEAARAAR